MVSRQESSAATRRSLLGAARALLNEGGPQRVTLREVGARADVSRGAAYRHFADKESLLAAVGAESWDRISEQLRRFRDDEHANPRARIQSALEALLTVGRDEPEVFRRMFTVPAADPELSIESASRAQAEFLGIVGDAVGPERAHLYGALLLTGAHGIASMDASGHLSPQMWETTPEQLVSTLVELVTPAA
ncbi:TetR family transcriptional regulator [Pseudoclavibacter sp. AY1F1]|uniref:TetR/AcrR family transcriptional regulator n=1 Tax=Pseudoclavibacter sp. AY1F1 TaxID=2080583 RepID=UPI000CE792B6|nr:TetR/AcrR family transcriptional regulator [Pseudoclavibacter sp. AY1F1]PPF45407.1 TetR family transcriptional regulator [Pseudoclavibacter sp. AY1F1]